MGNYVLAHTNDYNFTSITELCSWSVGPETKMTFSQDTYETPFFH
jgi:hypothetical protein